MERVPFVSVVPVTWLCDVNPGASWNPHFGNLPPQGALSGGRISKVHPTTSSSSVAKGFPERTSYLGFDQLGRRWVFDLMANRLRAVISYDLAGPGKVNVRSLGQRKRVTTWT